MKDLKFKEVKVKKVIFLVKFGKTELNIDLWKTILDNPQD